MFVGSPCESGRLAARPGFGQAFRADASPGLPERAVCWRDPPDPLIGSTWGDPWMALHRAGPMVAMSSQDTQSSDDGIQKAEPVRPPIDPFLVQPAAETGTPATDGAPAARAEAPGTDSTVDDQPADPAGAVAAEPPEAEAEATDHVSTRKPNGKRVLAFGAAAALLVGVGAGAGALGATALESSNTTTAQSGGTFGGFSGSSGSSDGSAPSFGNGSAPSFGNGSTPSFGGGFDDSG